MPADANKFLKKGPSGTTDTQWNFVTKTDVGLANVDNTSDVNKPVSIATATALGNKADKAITFTGIGLATVNTPNTLATNKIITVPKATLAEAQAGVLDNVAMTPFTTKGHVDAWANRGISGVHTGSTVAAAYPYTVGGWVGGLGTYVAANTIESDSTSVTQIYDYTRDITFDTKVGTFVLNENVTFGTSGWVGVVKAITATTLTLHKLPMTGYAVNNETLTGGTSGATALVNGTTTPSVAVYDGTLGLEYLYDNHYTMAIINEAKGYAYTSTTSNGKTDYALLLQSSRPDYLYSTVKGQTGALKIELYTHGYSDSTCISWQNRAVYVTDTVSTPAQKGLTGGRSVADGNLFLIHPLIKTDGTATTSSTLINFGTFLTHINPYDALAAKNGPRGVTAFHAQLSELDYYVNVGTFTTPDVQPNPVQAYAAFFSEENWSAAPAVGTTDVGTKGVKYIVAAHRDVTRYPYFKVTGYAHPDGPGRVRAVGSEANPAYAGIDNDLTGLDYRGTGMWFDNTDVVFSISTATNTDGHERLRIKNDGVYWNGVRVIP
jgi:hypothetical protein